MKKVDKFGAEIKKKDSIRPYVIGMLIGAGWMWIVLIASQLYHG